MPLESGRVDSGPTELPMTSTLDTSAHPPDCTETCPSAGRAAQHLASGAAEGRAGALRLLRAVGDRASLKTPLISVHII